MVQDHLELAGPAEAMCENRLNGIPSLQLCFAELALFELRFFLRGGSNNGCARA